MTATTDLEHFSKVVTANALACQVLYINTVDRRVKYKSVKKTFIEQQ
jgi:hypothetical protein